LGKLFYSLLTTLLFSFSLSRHFSTYQINIPPMDADYEYPIYGWTATNHYNETLDLFYHRWQTGREAQEIFLEQNSLVLEAEGGQPQQIQVNTGIVTRDDAQVAASWNSLWDDEEDSDNTEQEDSFYYCLSPEKVCSLESVTSTGGTVVSFSFIGEEGGREFPSTGGHINEGKFVCLSLFIPLLLHLFFILITLNRCDK
jgi:hypothetical protein